MTKRLTYILIFAAVLGIVALMSFIKHTKPCNGICNFNRTEEDSLLKVIVEDNKMSYITVQCDSLAECDSLDGLQVRMVEAFAQKYG